MGIECKSWPMRCLFLWEDRGSLLPHSSGLKKKKKNGEVNISNTSLQEYINYKAGFNMKYKLSSTLKLKYSLNHSLSNRDCQIPVLRMNSDPFQTLRRTHEQVLYEVSLGLPKATSQIPEDRAIHTQQTPSSRKQPVYPNSDQKQLLSQLRWRIKVYGEECQGLQ